jgi:two-component system LytT family sensor kinase
LLARSGLFKRLLFQGERSLAQKLKFVLFLGAPLTLGVMTRVLVGYAFADLSLEGSFLLGLMGGRFAGAAGALLITFPAFFRSEWFLVGLCALAGLLGGLIREIYPNKDEVWAFGPFPYIAFPRWLATLFRERRGDWQMLPLASCVSLDLARLALGRMYPGSIFYLDVARQPLLVLLFLSTIAAVALPIKIWNNTRIEMKLEERERLLLQARMEALSSQINPHFLFNTLNTVASLIRFEPDTARVVLIKLSNILRRLLKKQENFVPLREELSFIDDYLDIEVVRFGHDKLHIVKEVDEQTLDAIIPSMLLQPIIENSIKHGLSPRLEGGVIHIRTARRDGRVVIEVLDNGIGISEQRIPEIYHSGIGISNVTERLRVLYGEDFVLQISSRLGEGVSVRIEVPELITTYRR